MTAGPNVIAPVDLVRHTRAALDWGVVLEALSRHTATTAGQSAALDLPLLDTLADVAVLHAEVSEVVGLFEVAESVPMGGVVDLSAEVAQASRDSVLDLEQVSHVAGGVAALVRLRRWAFVRQEDCPALWCVAQDIALDDDFVELYASAIDAEGQLSSRRWPELGEIRERIREMTRGIKERLDELIGGGELGVHLQDRFYTERDGRYVVPLKSSAPRNLGIVHATSNTGETVFVEPGEIVARSNRLREAKSELERLERRILGQLTTALARSADAVSAAQDAAVRIDLIQARARLGEQLDGRLCELSAHGTVRLRGARHPVLVLRGVQVVPNDLELSTAHPCLLLTGPNTGGKTVALKTIGLAALFTRAGIPFPTEDGSRIDVFKGVIADVGDIQTVEGDLSTFSGHINVMKATLESAREDTLVLLDEVGVGTDPAQGAPLARAILEALVDTGARVAATTHYAEVKALPAADDRFVVAAMQYAHGRPTYRVAPGLAGQSHAFAIARRLALPGPIIERARSLMDTGARQLGDLMEKLEAREAELRILRDDLDERARVMASRERKLSLKESRLDDRRRKLETDIAARFTKRLRDREAEVKSLIATLQQTPDLDLAGRSLKQIKKIRSEVGSAAATRPSQAAPPPPKVLSVGDRVLVRSLDRPGVITELLGRERYMVRVGALPMKLKRADLARIDLRGRVIDAPPPQSAPKPPQSAPPPAKIAPTGPRQTPLPQADRSELAGLRMEVNTCDLRGQRIHRAIELLDAFLDEHTLKGSSVVFVLHGHGKGTLKTAVRQHLPRSRYVSAWRPCDPGEGGDAYTVVRLG